MTRTLDLRGFLTLVGLVVLLAGSRPALAQQLALSTNKGCGETAVFQLGEAVRITFGSNQTVAAQLRLDRPDGTTTLLFNGTLQGGVTRFIDGTAGGAEGTRTLTLTSGANVVTCAYRVGAPTAATQEARVPGILDFHGTQEALTVPSTVRAGEDFQVTITTFGGGCERAGETSVVLTNTEANLFVYDFTAATTPDVRCTTILNQFTHTVTVRLTQPGEALIRVWGRRVGADAPGGIPLVIQRRVVVQQ
jgi:hypothetical protein